MPELVADGRQANEHRRLRLEGGESVLLGRAPRTGWKIPWDKKISREHAEIEWQGEKLHVRCLKTARNPILFQGAVVSEFYACLGDRFQIGDTVFQLAEGADDPGSSSFAEHIFDPGELNEYRISDAGRRLELLSRLPDVVAASPDDEQLAAELARLLLQAIPRASGAALIIDSELAAPKDSGVLVRYSDPTSPAAPPIVCCESDPRSAEGFQPSRRLVEKALSREETVMHVWGAGGLADTDYTLTFDAGWAFCNPIAGEATRGWCLYLAGEFFGAVDEAGSEQAELFGDLRFASLFGKLVGLAKQGKLLEERQALLSTFFSPAVIEAFRSRKSRTYLHPSEGEITVLFCDLRGFSRTTESEQQDLLPVLHRVSDALSIMTRGIVKYEGIVADFLGDAALGFWGWPRPLQDAPLWACRAALDIHAEFVKTAEPLPDSADSSLRSGFKVGIGIAHGRAMAGKIGPDEQPKVGVFGPVVNLGARLEGMTKALRAAILVDEATAELVRAKLPPSEGRCRRLGRVTPYGLSTPITVFELLHPCGPLSPLTDDDIANYEAAVADFTAGRWHAALDKLDRLPVGDRAKDFLLIFIAQHNYEPPSQWDGVIPLSSK